MKFSVYNYDTHLYDYYENRRGGGTHAGSPPKSLVKSSLGATPEQAAWKLPVDAVKVGSGQMPIGRVASNGSPVAMSGYDLSSGAKIAVALGIAYLAYKAGTR